MADEIEKRGSKTYRINFCFGDWLFWRGKRSRSYRGSLLEWPKYLSRFIQTYAVTDVVYYQDRFPYHAAALELCRTLGVQCYTYEFGYLRPDWITLERDGMGAYSLIPSSPEAIRALAIDAGPVEREVIYPYPFWLEAVGEVIYNLSNLFVPWGYLRFDRDKFYNPLAEYLSILPRLLLSGRKNKAANMIIEDVVESGSRFFVFPLQLQSDYQLRYNSRFIHLGEAIDLVLESFAKAAPKAVRLVFKIHPLDNGIEPWVKLIKKAAKKYGVKRRIHVIDGGNLVDLLEKASGAIMVNSTTGLHALRLGCPVKILGIAVFDMKGITYQQSLDEFWVSPTPPDQKLLTKFERVLAATSQVRGNFYTKEGRKAAASIAADRLLDGSDKSFGSFSKEPPRLKQARKMGIPISFLEQITTRDRGGRVRSSWKVEKSDQEI
ncbi:capsule biosynthesis protein [Flexibacterium corallicola]|uniref:capsule biosynthesis protein n=1 Tax=Flexibacterium corallicola TaxID=3037259 RepID=UPI00286F938E|nr:capsular biosynthesis protein [Pseudovibrio sp. M1P-2-3]